MEKVIQQPIRFPFREDKACEAARLIISSGSFESRMKYLKLIKLMYLIDRKALVTTGEPIFGGRYASLDYGPIISDVYSLIKGCSPSGPWNCAVEKSGYFVSARNGADKIEALSDGELTIIREVLQEHGDKTEWELVSMCHELLPEWKDPNGSSLPIRIEDILLADHWSEEQIDDVRLNAEESLELSRLFSAVTEAEPIKVVEIDDEDFQQFG